MVGTIKKVAVIGAGAMGSGIAAQAANAGYEVVLLDIRETGARDAVERMKNATLMTAPFDAGFMDPANAKRVTTGTMADIAKIADADVVIEAVFERLDVKQDTFKLIEKHARADALITSNTSTLPISQLVDGMSESFRKRFMNMHFFNPPRIMRLLELIAGADTDPEAFEKLRDFGDRALGKKVVAANDTPGFIANRIGVFLMEKARTEAMKQGLSVEDVDEILGVPFGFPKLGIFKLADAVGLDVLQHVGKNLNDALPDGDAFKAIYSPAMVEQMVTDGYKGKKGKGGFYRVNPETRAKEALDLQTGAYRAVQKTEFTKLRVGNYAEFFDSDTPEAKFAWPVLRDMLLYVLDHAAEIAGDIQSVDVAMQVGYNWKSGPFQILDKCGGDWFMDRLRKEGIAIPALLEKAWGEPFYRIRSDRVCAMDFHGEYQRVEYEEGVIHLSDLKRGKKPLLANGSASLWDVGDGVVCVEFTSPNNSMDPAILHMLNESIKFVNASKGAYKAMVIYNDGTNFSVGANLKLIETFNKEAGGPKKDGTMRKRVENFVENLVYNGQAVYQALRHAPFPVIGAPRGKALGGGCEILLHCDALQAGAESYIGLVETGVGLIPAWGGCARYLERAQKVRQPFAGPLGAFRIAAHAIASPMDSMSGSAQDAKRKLWLRPSDGVSMNEDRILADAKARALAMVPGYQPPAPVTYNLPGEIGIANLRTDIDSLYFRGGDPRKGVNHVDVAVVDRLVHVLSGGVSLGPDRIDASVAQHGDHLKELAAKRQDGRIGVNPAITLTEGHILQMEREAFMALFRTKATQDRIAFTMTRGVPLREARPNPEPTPADIRGALTQDIALRPRTPDGKPLTGNDGRRLADMARTTERLYKLGS